MLGFDGANNLFGFTLSDKGSEAEAVRGGAAFGRPMTAVRMSRIPLLTQFRQA